MNAASFCSSMKLYTEGIPVASGVRHCLPVRCSAFSEKDARERLALGPVATRATVPT